MAIFCYICKKEVELVIFGNGLVGTCCNAVQYNSEDNQHVVRAEERKKASLSSAAPKKRRFHQAKRS